MRLHERFLNLKTYILGAGILLALGQAGNVQAKCVEYKAKDSVEATQMISDNWQEDYFEEITVNDNSNEIEIDGEKQTFVDTFSANRSEMKDAVSSRKNLEKYLETKEEEGKIYKVETAEDGGYTITAPYQTKRIIVHSAKVEKDYGAVEKCIYEKGNRTILSFETEEDTKNAYESIKKTYGKENCYVDFIFHEDGFTQGLSTCYSWGGSIMGMTSIRTDAGVASRTPVTVAVLDSGIDATCPIFNGTTIRQWNFVDNNANALDTYGHGTHVAGIIANLTPDNVQLLVLKILGANGYGSAYGIESAMSYAVEANVDVINMSAGLMTTDAKSYTYLDNVINKAYSKGIPVCVAAGNDEYGQYNNNINYCYPACNSQTIAVSALNKSLNVAWYSCYGSTVDFAAPGSDVYSAWIYGNLKKDSGTSMASPHIAAAMAYAKILDKNLSVEGCCLELRKYCVDLGPAGWDPYYGYGYPNIANMFINGETYGEWSISNMVSTPWISSCNNVKNGVELKWVEVSGAQGYFVYRKQRGGDYTKIAQVAPGKGCYIDTGANEGDYNRYYVVAYIKKNGIISESAKSNVMLQAVLRPFTIKSLKSLGGKKLQIIRKNQLCYTGEKTQVQYSSTKSFKKGKSKSYNSNLLNGKISISKKKTYFVRIRRVLTVDGKKYYSDWSNVKKVRMK